MERLHYAERFYRERHKREYWITGYIACGLAGFLIGMTFHFLFGL